uniref:non-specific serine/threonine protein kinase n=1 Tax=Oryza meridionalis TaxID=40149 RepID=A0A0E0EJF4_9ORYZ
MGAQINETTIPQCSEINTAGPQSWVSPSGRLAFGFYPEGEGFSIGVWLVTDPSRFIMWTAFRNDPPVSGGSILLTACGSLQWIPPNQGFQGKVISAAPTSATSAAILDTSNFVLYDAKKQVIWSIFGIPTDTLLPGQNLPPGNQLFSSVSDTNHATGKYRLSNQPDGNLVMYPIGAIDPDSAYWNTGTYAQNFLLTLTLDSNGTLWLFDRNSQYRMVLFLTNQSLSASPESESYYHLTLDADGILRLYSHVFFKQGGAPKTKVEWLVPPSNDRCSVKGVCGPNSFCQVTSSGETSCSCLPGFEFLSANQSTQGCWRAQTGGCTGNSPNGDIGLVVVATMVTVKNTSWSDRSYNIPPQSPTIEECKAICMSDCACEIAMFDSYCSKQMLPIRYGKRVPGSNTTLFVKVYSYEPKRTASATSTAMLTSGAALAMLSLVLLSVSVMLCKRRPFLRYTRAPQHHETEFDEESIGIRPYSFHDLELSTDGFAEELGRGAYGTVFKGVLTNSGNKGIAVKRLERMAEDGEREFKRDVFIVRFFQEIKLLSAKYTVFGVLYMEYSNHVSKGWNGQIAIGSINP